MSLNIFCRSTFLLPVSMTWSLSGASLGLSLVLSFWSSPQLSLHVSWSLCLTPLLSLHTPPSVKHLLVFRAHLPILTH